MPAVPEPLDRYDRLRQRRRALRERRRRRELQLRRLRPGRLPADQPVRRPADRGRRHADGAERAGRRAPQPGPPDRRRSADLRRHRAAARSADRHADAGQSPRRRRDRGRRPDHRLRPPQSLPHGAPARHQRDVGRRRRLERMGGGQPDRQHRRHPDRELRLALLRGHPEAGKLPGLQLLALPAALQRRGDRHRPVLRLSPQRQGGPQRGLRHRQLVGHRDRLLSRRRLPDAVRRRALRRRLLPELHLGGAARPQRRSRHGRGPDVRLGGQRAGAARDRPGRRSLLRRHQRRPHHARQLRRGEPTAGRGDRRRQDRRTDAARRAIRRLGLERSRSRRHARLQLGPRRQRHLRRLDAGGASAHL